MHWRVEPGQNPGSAGNNLSSIAEVVVAVISG
jgi:hypothetical protein